LSLEKLNAFEADVKNGKRPDPAISKLISSLSHQCAQEVLGRLKAK
jgi:hypothetical protein